MLWSGVGKLKICALRGSLGGVLGGVSGVTPVAAKSRQVESLERRIAEAIKAGNTKETSRLIDVLTKIEKNTAEGGARYR